MEKQLDQGLTARPSPGRARWRDEPTVSLEAPPSGYPVLGDRPAEGRGALAALAGSLSTFLSEFANSFGGWWQRRTLPDLLARYTPEDDTYYRAHFNYSDPLERTFERVQPAYMLGHISALNPDNADATWSELEPGMASAWGVQAREQWSDVRRYAWDAYARASSADYRGWRSRLLDSE